MMKMILVLMILFSQVLSSKIAVKTNADEQTEEQQLQAAKDALMAEYNKVYKGDFLFRKLKVSSNEADQFSLKTVYLNKYGLYYTDPGKDEVIDMVRFDEIIKKSEYDMIKSAYEKQAQVQKQTGMENINCCEGITTPKMYDIEFGFEAATLNCIFVNDPEYNAPNIKDLKWQICDQTFLGTSQFMDDIVTESTTIVSIKRFQKLTIEQTQRYIQIREGFIGISGLPIYMIDDSESEDVNSWTYQDQTTWSPTKYCGSKNNQSPIDLRDADVAYTTKNMQVKFFYEGDSTAQLVKGPNQNYLVGNFGKIQYIDLEEDVAGYKTYNAFRIEMHFKSEHQIRGSTSDIEILVYHSFQKSDFNADTFKRLYGDDINENKEYQFLLASTDLILSFMVQKKAILGEDMDGYFWSGFSYTHAFGNLVESKYQITSIVENQESQALSSPDQLFNLEGLIQGGLVNKFKKSFYSYSGSFSIPGCQQLRRIVMSEPIYISQNAFTNAEKIMKQQRDIDNVRSIQNVGTEGEEYTNQISAYRIRYHVDTSEICSQENLALEKFKNFDFSENDSGTQIKEYEAMIKKIKSQQETVQNILKFYKRIRTGSSGGDGDDPKRLDGDDKSDYTGEKTLRHQFETSIETNFGHMHQVPKQLVAKIFNDKVENLVAGHSDQQVVNRQGTNFGITYMGQNANQYAQMQYTYGKTKTPEAMIQEHPKLYQYQVPEQLKEIHKAEDKDAQKQYMDKIQNNFEETSKLLDHNVKNDKIDPVNKAISNLKEDRENKERINNENKEKLKIDIPDDGKKKRRKRRRR